MFSNDLKKGLLKLGRRCCTRKLCPISIRCQILVKWREEVVKTLIKPSKSNKCTNPKTFKLRPLNFVILWQKPKVQSRNSYMQFFLHYGWTKLGMKRPLPAAKYNFYTNGKSRPLFVLNRGNVVVSRAIKTSRKMISIILRTWSIYCITDHNKWKSSTGRTDLSSFARESL